MILRRSSSRCSRKLMAGMDSSGWFAGGNSAAISGIGALVGRSYFRARRFPITAGKRHRTGGWFGRRQDLLPMVLNIQLIDLGFDLSFEFVGSALALIEGAPYLASDLRQLLGPKNHQGQDEDEDHFRKPKIHIFMILPGW